MLDSRGIARLYLASRSSTWHWAEGGKLLVWEGGATIAFLQEVEMVLGRLAPRGLPDFEAVVLLLALSREGSRQRLKEYDVPLLREVLENVEGLLPVLEGEPLARAALAEMVFERGQRRSSPEAAALVLEGLRGSIGGEDLETRLGPEDTQQRIFDHLRWLRLNLYGIDCGALTLRMRTGLDRLPLPAPFELPETQSTRALIARLLEDPELSGLARLARALMAAAHIPRAVSEPEEMPLGGTSDISNRGTLDRLLPSELAHDEATFAVRIALNEALFLRPESPPRAPPRARMVLIDSGIRLWGVPRIFSTAAALAFAATADERGEVSVLRPSGESLIPVDLRTHDGLIAHLEALETAAHPGEALPAFFEALTEHDAPADGVLVTHEDVVRDPQFQRALAHAGAQPIHIAEVSRDGAFRLLLHSRAGKRVLRQARIDLDAVLSPPRSAARGPPLFEDEDRPDLPVLLAVRPFPFLLPYHGAKRIVASAEAGVVGITHDGRLIHWTLPGLGARQLTDAMPSGPLLWRGLDDDQRVLLLIGPDGARGPVILTADAATGETRSALLETGARGVRGAGKHRDTLFLIYPDRVEGFDSHTGARICELSIPSTVQWSRERFFRLGGPGYHVALAYDGTAARFELISSLAPMSWDTTCFDRQGHDGPWAVTDKGTILSAATRKEIKLSHGLEPPVGVEDISPGGRFVTLSSSRSGRRKVLGPETQGRGSGEVAHGACAASRLRADLGQPARELGRVGPPLDRQGRRERVQGDPAIAPPPRQGPG